MKTFSRIYDAIFQKALLYIANVSVMKDGGDFDEVSAILNFVKCIELISMSVGIASKKTDPKTNKKINKTTKEMFEEAGRKISVPKRLINISKKAWDVRNNSDIAHANGYRIFAPISFYDLEECAIEYLVKYARYIGYKI